MTTFEELLTQARRFDLLGMRTSVGIEAGTGRYCTNWSPGSCGKASRYAPTTLAELEGLPRCAVCTWDEVLLEAGRQGEVGLSTVVRVLGGAGEASAAVQRMNLLELETYWREVHDALTQTQSCADALAEVRSAVGNELSSRLLGALTLHCAREVVENQLYWLSDDAKEQAAVLVASDQRKALVRFKRKIPGTRVTDQGDLVAALVASTALDEHHVLVELPVAVAQSIELSGSRWVQAQLDGVAVLGADDTQAVLEAAATLLTDAPTQTLSEVLEVARAL